MSRGGGILSSSSPMWLVPAVVGAVTVPVALLMGRWEAAWVPDLLWHGDLEATRTLLQVVATAVISATTLTFSVTVVALQLASQQYSPRLLREFAHDRVTKIVLTTFSATFVHAISTMTTLRDDDPVPRLSATVAFLLGLASLVALLTLIAHLLRSLRVDTMMLTVHEEADQAIASFYQPYGADVPDGSELSFDGARLVLAARAGFVQRIRTEHVVEAADRSAARVLVEVRAGDHVVAGTPVAAIHVPGDDAEDVFDLERAILAAVELGYERTADMDVGFAFRQLEDIAVKAMSPSINDPATASHAVGHLSRLLVRLAQCRLGATLHRGARGGAVVVPDRDFRYYLDAATGQLRRLAGREPTVLQALLRMLRDVAVACRDDEQRAEVAHCAQLVADEVDDDLHAEDRRMVEDMLERVHLALGGRVRDAYADRAGETRSL